MEQDQRHFSDRDQAAVDFDPVTAAGRLLPKRQPRPGAAGIALKDTNPRHRLFGETVRDRRALKEPRVRDDLATTNPFGANALSPFAREPKSAINLAELMLTRPFQHFFARL